MHRTSLSTLVGAAAAVALTVGLAQGTTAAATPSDTIQPDPFPVQLVKVDTPFESDKERLHALGLDLTEHAGHDYIEVVLHTPEDVAKLTEAKLSYTVEVPDLLARGVEVARLNEEYAAKVKRSRLPSGSTGYRTLGDYNNEMKRLAKRNPQKVRTFTLKHRTIDGRQVRAIEIARNVKRRNDGRPTFVLMGLHHAREWPSGELAIEFAHDLVKNMKRPGRIRSLTSRARTIVVPVVNPDGFHLSRTDGEFVDLRGLNDLDPLDGTLSTLLTPGQAYKRKNCRPLPTTAIDNTAGLCRLTGTSPGGFGIGVDLNRNYGGFWGGPGAAATEPNPTEVEVGFLDPTYRGTAPFSEPETKNIQSLVSSRQVTMLISNHTFSNLVLRPNGVNPTTIGHDGKPVGNAPDEKALKELGRKMTNQNGYRNIHGWQLYDTTGTTEDWSYNATGGFGYTYEIGANEFHPPYPEVVSEYVGAGKYKNKGNREAYLIALAHAADTRHSGVLKGKLPRGGVIELRKSFRTPTWESSYQESISSRFKSRGGKFSWIVNPSTRPVVRPRTFEKIASKPYRRKKFNGSVPAPSSHVDHTFKLGSRADLYRVGLDWTAPDDLDLSVYRKVGGKLRLVGTSGSLPGVREEVSIADAKPGTYVARVINYASVPGQPYSVTNALFRTKTRTTPGKRESYRLTCGDGRRVFSSTKIFIDRGGVKQLNLSKCRKALRR